MNGYICILYKTRLTQLQAKPNQKRKQLGTKQSLKIQGYKPNQTINIEQFGTDIRILFILRNPTKLGNTQLHTKPLINSQEPNQTRKYSQELNLELQNGKPNQTITLHFFCNVLFLFLFFCCREMEEGFIQIYKDIFFNRKGVGRGVLAGVGVER